MNPEVEFVLDAIDSNYGEALEDVPLKRVDRDNSDILEDDVHTRTGKLEETNFVGARFADRSPTPIGTEYDHRIEAVVGVRIEGMHHSEYGHIDPDGVEGVDWDELVRKIRRAILTERKFPDVGRSDTGYTYLSLANEVDTSSEYADYYRYDMDILFFGFEELP